MATFRDINDISGMYSKAGRYCVEIYTILQKDINGNDTNNLINHSPYVNSENN